MKTFPWVKHLKRSSAELPYDSPIYLGNTSNGEYFHTQTERERKLREEILRVGDEKARRLNIDRREFMASAMGFVTALSVIQGCSAKPSSQPNNLGAGGFGSGSGAGSGAGTGATAGTGAGVGAAAGTGAGTGAQAGTGSAAGMGASGGMDAGTPAGQYCFDTDSDVDPTMCESAARQILNKPNFIFDGQTHCFDDAPDAAWRSSPPPGFNDSLAALLGNNCGVADKVSCIGPDDYVRLMFLNSDTTMAVLSAWPYGQGGSDPNNNTFLAATRDWVNIDLAASHRLVNHASIVPYRNVTSDMSYAVTQFGVGGWKLYPASPPSPFKLDDPMGRAIIEAGIRSGVKTFAVHKGLPISGFSQEHNMPDDVGVVAKAYPDVNFIIYHSAICAGQSNTGFTCTPMENDYVMGSKQGSDALITSLIDNGIAPNSNVFAETGGAFVQLMSNPASAGKWFAKLVKYVGENNVIWGTDSILSGNSPQGQINAFMALDHPTLTPAVKAKILGLNGARLYCVDPAKQRCQVDQSKIAAYKRDLDGEFGEYRWVLLGHQRPIGPTTRREFIRLRQYNKAMGVPG